MLTAFVLLIWLIPARADDLPNAPTKTTAPVDGPDLSRDVNHHSPVVFPRKIFWPLVAACGTAAVVDAQTSHAYIVSHPNATETGAWLLGRRPSLGRYYVTFAVMDGGAAIISYKLLHSRRKPLRVIGWSLLGGLTAIHAEDDIEMALR